MNRFSELVDLAMKDASLVGLRPVVEKEILHYDIMFALEKRGLFQNIVFQGGTALRLCYGALRFSEDLDFVGGRGFAPSHLAEIKACVEDHVGRLYGLDVHVKEPREMRQEPSYMGVEIDRWQISVVTSPARSDIPRQKIKIEVANVPAYRPEPRPPVRNYACLPSGYQDILIPVESLDEIYADKIVSFSASQGHVRNRDVWDLRWLQQQGAKLDIGLVTSKIGDYRIRNFEERLEARLAEVDNIVLGGDFQTEMRRFLAADVRQRTLDKPGFLPFLSRNLKEMLEKARISLDRKQDEPEFLM